MKIAPRDLMMIYGSLYFQLAFPELRKKMLTDCEKCWDTPCSCGYGYRQWTKEARAKLAAAVLGVEPAALLPLAPEQHPKTGEL